MSIQQKPKQASPARPPLTHFLCLPLVNAGSEPQLRESLTSFREQMRDNGLFSPQAIRPLGTLHCTLGVMSLDEEQLEKAKQVLGSINVAEILDGLTTVSSGGHMGAVAKDGPLAINLRGLYAFRQPTSVLYSDPKDKTGRLYPFCQEIKEKFQRFLVDEHRDLTLHATMINTIYAKGARARGRGGGGRSSATICRFQTKFDASAIIEQFRDFEWASNVTLDRLCICEMGAKKISDDSGRTIDEKYTEVAKIDLPT